MMDHIEKIVSMSELQRRREQFPRHTARVEQPLPKRVEELCPNCKTPLTDTSHGWIREYRPHDDHHGHFQKSGFCMIPCPMCSGGVEAKRTAQLINSLFGDAHIPFYAKDWAFSTYPANADQQAKDAVRQFILFCLADKSPKRALYLVGGKGHGKTSLAISALQSVLKKGRPGVFITTVELFDLLRGAIAASKRIERGDSDFQDKYEASQGAKLLRLIKTVEWLVLDDLGVECGTKYVIQQLYLIIEARRSAGLYTIFTSNRDAADLEKYWRSDDDEVFQDGQRIIDRIGEYCLSVSVKGTNQRMRERMSGGTA